MTDQIKLPRSAGILLHPTSFFTRYGIGDLGPNAYAFVDFLAKCGISFWQTLPLGPTGFADSPYQNISAFAGNPLLISPDELVKQKLLNAGFIEKTLKEYEKDFAADVTKVNFEPVHAFKNKIFQESFTNFHDLPDSSQPKKNFEEFCTQNGDWLDEFALFFSINKANQYKSWIEWEEKYCLRDPTALEEWKTNNKKDLLSIKFEQWQFQVQWQYLRDYAHQKKIQIIGDMPIFVAHNSSDVWAHKEYFTLNSDGSLEYQAGVPPDYFSKTGQLWGNPLYRWDILKKEKYQWFIQRFKRSMMIIDWLRVDHFRGFEAFWQIGGKEKTAINGKWVKAPGKNLFQTVRKAMGQIQIIAEDLGVITPEVEELRDYFEFPGMRVLQFAFGGDAKNPHLPHNYVHNSIAYTGTHDNDTTLGWWQTNCSDKEKAHISRYLSLTNPIIPEDLIKAIYRSVANLCIIPMQDVLGQDSSARMNTPSVPQGNWQYRLPANCLTDEKARWLRHLVELYGRLLSA